MMGVSSAEERDFRRWAGDLVVGNSITSTAEQAERALEATSSLRAYFSDLIAERRVRPTDDLVSRLVEANENDTLADNELLASCILLLFAGLETTTGLIVNAAVALIEHPEQRAQLVTDPALMTSALEEFLRFAGPPQAALRTATEDLKLGGAQIAQGEHLIILVGSANRDEEVFPYADQLVLERDPNPHVAFSFGPHYCLGANLARLETRIALAGLLERAPTFERADPTKVLAYRPGFFIRSLERLDLAIH
jgi:cytochrome P450